MMFAGMDKPAADTGGSELFMTALVDYDRRMIVSYNQRGDQNG